ncbi:hypothetical protein B0H10DRAFT_1999782 [Mycena sp. CBHHK59/15]|nr:hypothetical protein B0H10DRAFT_1999782 [Mycena sp. CBHHK59/15]
MCLCGNKGIWTKVGQLSCRNHQSDQLFIRLEYFTPLRTAGAVMEKSNADAPCIRRRKP